MLKKLAMVLLMSGLMIPVIPTLQAQNQDSDEEVPYIYYFQDDMQAFVVERADGTDRHILGAGIIPEPEDETLSLVITGPGWSPSGQWFAWTTAYFTGYTAYGFTPYVMNIEGTQALTMLDSLNNAQLAWSPDEDILLVATHETNWAVNQDTMLYEEDSWHVIFTLVNVENTQPIAQWEGEIILDDCCIATWSEYIIAFTWLADGKHAVVGYLEASEAVFILLSTDGEIIEKHFDNIISGAFRVREFVSKTGNIAYRQGDILIIENLVTGHQARFDGFEDLYPEIFWNPTGDYALISTREKTWVLDASSDELEPRLLEITIPKSFSDSPAVDPNISIWSPDGKKLVFWTEGNYSYDAHFVYYYANLETSKVTAFQETVNTWPHFWWENDGTLFAYGGDNLQDIKTYLYHYNFDLSMLPLHEYILYPEPYPSSYPRVSPNNKTIAYVHAGTTILNIEQCLSFQLPPDFDAWNSGSGGEIRWHKDGQWFFIFENASVVGGGNQRHIGIARYDGGVHRELTYSSVFPSSATIGWLPEQVDIEKLPASVLIDGIDSPEPEQTLMGENWTFFLDWSPDSKQIFSTSYNLRESQGHIWDVETGSRRPFPFIFTGDMIVVWEKNNVDIYEPILKQRLVENRLIHPDIINPGKPQIVKVVVVDTSEKYVVEDTETGEQLYSWDRGQITGIKFSPDGNLLVTVGYGYSPAQLWDTDTWEVVATLPTATQAVAFSPDGQYLAASSSWYINIWNVEELLAANKAN